MEDKVAKSVYDFVAVEIINKCDFCLVIINFFNYSSYNWKPKLVLAFIHNFPTSLIISDDISETNNWKDFTLLW